MSDTNAVKWLRSQGVAFDVLTYAYEQFGAEAAAAAVDRPLEMVCKTLVAKATGNAHWLVIVPGDQRLDLRRLTAGIGCRHVEMAPPAEAEKVTGYKVGGISPFAQRRKLPVAMEETLLLLERMIVNGGRRGVLVEMATADFVKLTEGRAMDLCHG
jgi:Cys-tRNA(Pro)/Cys-tRNA(Cys) deacylase